MSRFSAAAFAVVLAICAFSAPVRGESVSERLRCDVEFLSDSLCQGRRTGTAGAVEASWMVARRFASAGLQTFSDDGWFQSFSCGGSVGRNIVGILPGTSGRYVVVAAHIDGFPGSGFLPGADSNASGVSALLELVRSLTDSGGEGRPVSRRTGVIFAVLDGSNADYAGAKALISELKRRSLLQKISLFVNLDMLGTTLSPVDKGVDRFIIALGGNRYYDSLEKAARPFGIDVNYDYYGSRNFTDLFYRRIGDHTVFQGNGVHTVVFTSGITMNTNLPHDTPDTLDYGVFSLRLLFLSSWLSGLIQG